MRQYKELISRVLSQGLYKQGRGGWDTLSLFGAHMCYDMSEGFPAVTIKKFNFAATVGELTCFIGGYTDNKDFNNFGCHYWDANLKAWNDKRNTPDNTDLGPIYGSQWRNHNGDGYDQLEVLLKDMMVAPYSRRLMLVSWNPGKQKEMCLPPCYISMQINIVSGFMDLMFHMRSVDLMLGFPSDICNHAIILMLLARQARCRPRNLIFTAGDVHIYTDHLNSAKKIMLREPLAPPTLSIDRNLKTILDFKPEHVTLDNYESYPYEKLVMAT